MDDLFSGQSQHKEAPNPALNHLGETANSLGSRVAVLEERLTNLRHKSQLTEQTLLEHQKSARTDLKAMSQRVTELARKVEDIREKIDGMAGELSSVVKKHDLTVLERYMDLWQPMDFVTRDEAKLMIREMKK